MKIARRLPSPKTSLAFFATGVALLTTAGPAHAAPGVPGNGKVSFSAFYGETNASAAPAGISDDGRFAAYYTWATNIVDEDTTSRGDIYMYDRLWGLTELISVALDGNAGDGDVAAATDTGRCVSADGRFVAFSSSSSNLVTGDRNETYDVFVRDRTLGTTQRVSLGVGRTEIKGESYPLGMTANGQKILFGTEVSLVGGDTNNQSDLYLHDRISGVTTLVTKRPNGSAIGTTDGTIDSAGNYVAFGTSVSLVGADTNSTPDLYRIRLSDSSIYLVSASTTGVVAANGYHSSPWISGDGTRVAFTSSATNLVSGDSNNDYDVFVKNITNGQMLRASTSSAGAQSLAPGCASATLPTLSTTGRYVSMNCRGSDLVPGDTNGVYDSFIKDLQLGTMTLVSRVAGGAIQNKDGDFSMMTPDGSKLLFGSWGTNLTPGTPDTNNARDIFVANRQ